MAIASNHFIAVLVDTFEVAYSNLKRDGAEDNVQLVIAVQAADQVAANNWYGQAERAGAVAGAILRALFGANAAAEAAGLSAMVRLHIADAEDPQTREQIAAAQQQQPAA